MPTPPDTPLFAPGPVLDAMAAAGVRLVIVGAFSAQLRGIPVTTRDLDVVPDLDPANLQRLAEVLHAHGATVRIRPYEQGQVNLPPDGGLLARAPILNLHIPHAGDVDVIHRAAGERGLYFDDLVAGATALSVPGAADPVLVMSEADWVLAKRAPPVREKDALHLAVYEAWRSGRPT